MRDRTFSFFFGTISPAARRMTVERSLWISLVILFLYLHTLAWLRFLAYVDPYLDRSVTVSFFADSFLLSFSLFCSFSSIPLTRRWRANEYARVNRYLGTDVNEERANRVWVSGFLAAARRNPELAKNRRNPPPDLKEIRDTGGNSSLIPLGIIRY